MAANRERKQKRIRLQKPGNYVQKKSWNGALNSSNTLFECMYLPKNQDSKKKCKIKNIFSPNCQTTMCYAKDLIPQTVVYYHKDCKKHKPLIQKTMNAPHPECPERIFQPMKFLQKYGLLDKCVVLYPKEATIKQLLLTHCKDHIDTVQATKDKAISYNMAQKEKEKKEERTHNKAYDDDNDDDVDMVPDEVDDDNKDDTDNDEDFEMDDSVSTDIGWLNKEKDTYFNEYSLRAAKLAAGAAIALIKNILNNRCVTGIAIIRPPGHHCEHNIPMGFCLFNNVAVAVNVVKQKGLYKKILIVDWDLHHGNGTQNMFYKDKNVLYFSVHRYDNGHFYPYTGKVTDHGKGYNVNVPLNESNGRYGDAAYMDIWKCILIPIASEFKPDIIIISAGFDACIEDTINGNKMAISPPCYGVLCRMLMNVCPKVAVILEGGYNINTMTPAIGYVTWALLRGPIDNLYEYGSPEKYNQHELKLYVENTLWYKSIFFEYEFKRFVLDMIENDEEYYKCNKEYDIEQKQDLTKIARRSVMKKVLMQHRRYWTVLTKLYNYFKKNY